MHERRGRDARAQRPTDSRRDGSKETHRSVIVSAPGKSSLLVVFVVVLAGEVAGDPHAVAMCRLARFIVVRPNLEAVAVGGARRPNASRSARRGATPSWSFVGDDARPCGSPLAARARRAVTRADNSYRGFPTRVASPKRGKHALQLPLSRVREHWWSVPRFEAQPSQLASHDATWARVRERTPSPRRERTARLASHRPLAEGTRAVAMRVKTAGGPRRPGATSLPERVGVAPRRRKVQFDDQRPGWDFHHERHREVQAHPRAGRGTRPARSRRVPFARRVPHSPCPPPSSRGSRPNRFCLGSRPRDAHFQIPPTTETTPPSSRRPRSSSSSPRTSPRHAPPLAGQSAGRISVRPGPRHPPRARQGGLRRPRRRAA